MNDQHVHLRLPSGDPLCDTLAVDDLDGCGISHRCTISDKWPQLLAVDNDYCVRLKLDRFTGGSVSHPDRERRKRVRKLPSITGGVITTSRAGVTQKDQA
jgi:hypothetical protein